MRKFYLGVALAMTMASCTQEELVNSMGESKLNATVESANGLSRVGFEKDEDWSFFWHNGDEIWVNEGIMSTNDADKSKTATFTGYGIDTNTGYAVYPYAMAEDNVSGTQLTWNFPSTYTYDNVDADFFASAQGIPMYAVVYNGNASFKHLGAIVAFKFNDWEFTGEHIFTLTSSKKISGEFTTDLSGETPVFATATEGEDVVTVTYNRPADATGTSVVFYVPIPTGTYDLNVKVTVDGATKFTKASNNKTVNRGDIVWAELGESVLVGDNKDTKVVSKVSDITDKILSTEEENLTVQVSDEVTGTENTIEIPASLSAATTTFSFASVADAAKITIKDADGGSYAGQIIIEVPEEETIPEVVANIPNGEVYIKQGTVTTLVSSSAYNTTIIGKDAIVGTLTVAKGNVRIEEGGQVTKIERASENSAIVYVIYESATAPEIETGEGVVLMSVAEYEFQKAIDNNETLYQISDIATLELFREAVNGGKDFAGCTIELMTTIDLNNEQWSPIGTSENPFKGTFDGKNNTIKNLSIVEAEAKEGKAYIGFFGYASNVTIKNVTFENVNLNIACLDIDHSQGHIGAVVGSLEGTSTIENVTVKGDIKVEATFDANGASRVAVVAGGNVGGDVTMRNVHVQANEGSYLKANNNVGALAGQLQVKNVFENCSSNIDVTAKKFFAGGLIGIAAGNSTFTNCHTTGDVTVTAGREGRANDHYRVGGIAGGWADNVNTPCVLTDCSYTGKISGTNSDGSVAEPLDYAGYVGRGYTLTNRAGSEVIIDGVYYIQKYNDKFGEYDVYAVGTIAEFAGVKGIIYEITDEAFKVVSVEECVLAGKTPGYANTWAESLGEGWTLTTIDDLDVIHNVRLALNGFLKADDANNALFEEDDYIDDAQTLYAIYISSTVAEGSDPLGDDYFANRVFLKRFNKKGYWDVPRSTFDTINPNAPLRAKDTNYLARAVYTVAK